MVNYACQSVTNIYIYMDVNLYTFVGDRAPTMAQMGTHKDYQVIQNDFTAWAPTIVVIIVKEGSVRWWVARINVF